MPHKIELVLDIPCETAEGPLWHPGEQALYWLDIPKGRMFRLDPSSGNHKTIFEGEVVGGATLQEDGTFLFFMNRGAIKIWRNGHLETVVENIPGMEESRFNDAVAAPDGSVFSGTMPIPNATAQLYRLQRDRKLTCVMEGLGQSNGMDFSPDHNSLYLSDTKEGTIVRYPYADGELGTPELVTRVKGKPDGLVVDAAGGIWSARWGGGCLVRLDTSGRETDRIDLPLPKVSSAIFGGEDLRDLYITTAGGNEREKDGPLAGSLFRARLEIPGQHPLFSRIG